MPKFKAWAESIGVDINNVAEPLREITADPPIENPGFVESIRGKVDEISTNESTRVFHSHGHSLK
jgi:hypothetical protein